MTRPADGTPVIEWGLRYTPVSEAFSAECGPEPWVEPYGTEERCEREAREVATFPSREVSREVVCRSLPDGEWQVAS